jgi:hypothetical protein
MTKNCQNNNKNAFGRQSVLIITQLVRLIRTVATENGQAMVQSCRTLQIQTTILLWRVLMTCMRQKRMQSCFVCLVLPFAAKCNYFHVLASDQEPYAGLLMPDTTVDYCSIWLSSAIQPPSAEFDKSRLAMQAGCFYWLLLARRLARLNYSQQQQ